MMARIPPPTLLYMDRTILHLEIFCKKRYNSKTIDDHTISKITIVQYCTKNKMVVILIYFCFSILLQQVTAYFFFNTSVKVTSSENVEQFYMLGEYAGRKVKRFIPNSDTLKFLSPYYSTVQEMNMESISQYDTLSPVKPINPSPSNPDEAMLNAIIKMEAFQVNLNLIKNITMIGWYWNPTILPWNYLSTVQYLVLTRKPLTAEISSQWFDHDFHRLDQIRFGFGNENLIVHGLDPRVVQMDDFRTLYIVSSVTEKYVVRLKLIRLELNETSNSFHVTLHKNLIPKDGKYHSGTGQRNWTPFTLSHPVLLPDTQSEYKQEPETKEDRDSELKNDSNGPKKMSRVLMSSSLSLSLSLSPSLSDSPLSQPDSLFPYRIGGRTKPRGKREKQIPSSSTSNHTHSLPTAHPSVPSTSTNTRMVWRTVERLLFVEQINPLTVIEALEIHPEHPLYADHHESHLITREISRAEKMICLWEYEDSYNPWNCELRGGSGPKLIAKDTYLSFFHTRRTLPSNANKLTYFFGAYTFSTATLPFQLLSVSPSPIYHPSFYTGDWGNIKSVDYNPYPMDFFFNDSLLSLYSEEQDWDAMQDRVRDQSIEREDSSFQSLEGGGEGEGLRSLHRGPCDSLCLSRTSLTLSLGQRDREGHVLRMNVKELLDSLIPFTPPPPSSSSSSN